MTGSILGTADEPEAFRKWNADLPLQIQATRPRAARRCSPSSRKARLIHRTRTPRWVSRWSGFARRGSGASGTAPMVTPYFQSGGQMAM